MGPFRFRLFVFLVAATCLASGTASAQPACGAVPAEPGSCPQQIFINPLPCGGGPEYTTSCNCSEIRGLVSAELEGPRRQLEQLHTAVSSQESNVSSELQETRLQLRELETQIAKLTAAFSSSQDGGYKGLPLQSAETASNFPKDCTEASTRGAVQSGIYKIQPEVSPEAFEVFCDMETDGGGWTVFQRRYDGSVDFYRNYANYSQGFGYLSGECWLGNEKLHNITEQGAYELRVDLTDIDGNLVYARYGSFAVDDASGDFRLTVGDYAGTAGDSMHAHNGEGFTTMDMDNDRANGNCAVEFHGAWWYRGCYVAGANLNGRYDEIEWFQWRSVFIESTQMAVRRKM